MKSKITILAENKRKYMLENGRDEVFIDELLRHENIIAPTYVLSSMDEYAKSLAKEVISELEKYYSLGIAIDIIKQKFNLI